MVERGPAIKSRPNMWQPRLDLTDSVKISMSGLPVNHPERLTPEPCKHVTLAAARWLRSAAFPAHGG
jgi:hypothetical protein